MLVGQFPIPESQIVGRAISFSGKSNCWLGIFVIFFSIKLFVGLFFSPGAEDLDVVAGPVPGGRDEDPDQEEAAQVVVGEEKVGRADQDQRVEELGREEDDLGLEQLRTEELVRPAEPDLPRDGVHQLVHRVLLVAGEVAEAGHQLGVGVQVRLEDVL